MISEESCDAEDSSDILILIKMIRETRESNDLWYGIRLEHFETLNHFSTQWFNWFGVSNSSVYTVFFARFLGIIYSLFE